MKKIIGLVILAAIAFYIYSSLYECDECGKKCMSAYSVQLAGESMVLCSDCKEELLNKKYECAVCGEECGAKYYGTFMGCEGYFCNDCYRDMNSMYN